MIWKCHYRVIAGLLLLALAGCGRAATSVAEQTVDGVTIALERPAELALLQDYELIVALRDSASQPIDGATVFLEPTMPAMPMGSNQPLGEPLGGGRYRIRGVFTMEGRWLLKIHVVLADVRRVAVFEQQVQPGR